MSNLVDKLDKRIPIALCFLAVVLFIGWTERDGAAEGSDNVLILPSGLTHEQPPFDSKSQWLNESIFRDSCYPPYGPPGLAPPVSCGAAKFIRRFVNVRAQAKLGAFKFSVTSLCFNTSDDRGVPDELLIARLRGPQIIVPRAANHGNGTQFFTAIVTSPGVYYLEISVAHRFDWSAILRPMAMHFERDMRPFFIQPVQFSAGWNLIPNYAAEQPAEPRWTLTEHGLVWMLPSGRAIRPATQSSLRRQLSGKRILILGDSHAAGLAITLIRSLGSTAGKYYGTQRSKVTLGSHDRHSDIRVDFYYVPLPESPLPKLPQNESFDVTLLSYGTHSALYSVFDKFKVQSSLSKILQQLAPFSKKVMFATTVPWSYFYPKAAHTLPRVDLYNCWTLRHSLSLGYPVLDLYRLLEPRLEAICDTHHFMCGGEAGVEPLAPFIMAVFGEAVTELDRLNWADRVRLDRD